MPYTTLLSRTRRAFLWQTICLSALSVLSATLIPITAAHAQQVIPVAFATTEGSANTYVPYQSSVYTYQAQYTPSALGALSPGTKLTSLQFRLDSGASAIDTAYTSYTIQLAQAANSVGNMSSSFAANMIAPVTVYNAPLSVTAASFPSGGSPNDFGPVITFSTPYTYVGGDLVLYFTHSSSLTPTANGFPVDGLVSNASAGYYAQFNSTVQNASITSLQGVNVVIAKFGATAAPEPGGGVLLALGLTSGIPVAGILVRRWDQRSIKAAK